MAEESEERLFLFCKTKTIGLQPGYPLVVDMHAILCFASDLAKHMDGKPSQSACPVALLLGGDGTKLEDISSEIRNRFFASIDSLMGNC